MKSSNLKTIVFVRHAKSSQNLIDVMDIHRPLNQRGYEDASLMSKELAKQKLKPDTILTSPAIRAYSTALIFANQFDFNAEEIKLHQQFYDTDAKTILNVIYNIAQDIQTVFIFGHNPDMENCINLLIKNKIERLPTTGVCVISTTSKSWKEIKKDNCSLQLFKVPSDFKEKTYESEKTI